MGSILEKLKKQGKELQNRESAETHRSLQYPRICQETQAYQRVGMIEHYKNTSLQSARLYKQH